MQSRKIYDMIYTKHVPHIRKYSSKIRYITKELEKSIDKKNTPFMKIVQKGY